MRVGTIILTACVLAVPLTAQNPAPAASERDTAAKAVKIIVPTLMMPLPPFLRQ